MSSLAEKSKGEDRNPGFSDEVVKIFKVEGEEKQFRNYTRRVVVSLILVSKNAQGQQPAVLLIVNRG